MAYRIEYFSIWRRRWEKAPQCFPELAGTFETKQSAVQAIASKASEAVRDAYRIVED